MTLRRALRLLILAIVALAIVVVAVWLDLTKLFEPEAAAPEPVRGTTEVQVGSIGEAFEAEGQIDFSGLIEVTSVPGAYDVLPAGTTVDANDVLFRVDGQPVVALIGETPMFRDIGVDDVGVDVQQLEQSLVDLGFDPGVTVTVDQTFTANTELMVERWQRSVGATDSGQVALSSVVFIPGPAQVAGLENPAAVLGLQTVDRVLTFTVPVSDIATLATGDVVSALLPDRSRIDVAISAIGPVQNAAVEVTADIPADAQLPSLDIIAATISWDRESAIDVLALPPGVFVRLDSGDYAVEVVEPSGATSFVSVQLGERSGTSVELSGDGIAEGTVVINP